MDQSTAEVTRKAREALAAYRQAKADAEAVRDAQDAAYAAEEAALLSRLLRERLGVEVALTKNEFQIPDLELEFYAAPEPNGAGLRAVWTQNTEEFGVWNVTGWEDVAKLLDGIAQRKAFAQEVMASRQAREVANESVYRMVFLNPSDGLNDVVEGDADSYELKDVDLNALAAEGWRVKATFVEGPRDRYSHALLLEREPRYDY